jgi:hypothetical protein
MLHPGSGAQVSAASTVWEKPETAFQRKRGFHHFLGALFAQFLHEHTKRAPSQQMK